MFSIYLKFFGLNMYIQGREKRDWRETRPFSSAQWNTAAITAA